MLASEMSSEPRAAARTFTDADQLSATLRSGQGKYRILGRGVFRAESTIVALGRVTIQCARESLARVAYHAMEAGKVGVLGWPAGGALPVVRGMRMRSGELLSLGADMESYHRTSGGNDYVSLLVDADELRRASIDLTGREMGLASGEVRRPSSRALAALQALIGDARRVARVAPEIFEAEEVRRSLEQSLLRALIGCLEDGAQRSETATNARRAQIMSRFEAVAEANAARPIHVLELCRRVGVAERTLRKCCQEHLGMSPHQYLLRRRIHLARNALLRGDPNAATVTSIATSHGFWELGRFAAHYRAMFGEPPSATLRRRAEFA